MTPLRRAPFALRFVQHREGLAGIVYARRATADGKDRLQKVATLRALAVRAGTGLLRQAIVGSGARKPADDGMAPGPSRPLDAEWGPRVACYALVVAGLREPERLIRAAEHLRRADPDEAAWWLGLLTHDPQKRALRALRILTEAVE